MLKLGFILKSNLILKLGFILKLNLIPKLVFILKLNLILKLGFILKFVYIQNFELILNILGHPKPSISSSKQPGRLVACYLEIIPVHQRHCTLQSAPFFFITKQLPQVTGVYFSLLAFLGNSLAVQFCLILPNDIQRRVWI